MDNRKNIEKPLTPAALPAKDGAPQAVPKTGAVEYGGAKGPEPTRYGDWEHKGRCSDF